MEFKPNYQNIVDAAQNRVPQRLPLYEHIISWTVMEEILGEPFAHLYQEDKDKFFSYYCRFFREMGYDTVSFEGCITDVLPGGGALGGHKKGAIQSWEDYEKYPWDQVEQLYFDTYGPAFEALRRNMPEGMKAIGGVGNGVFECVQDLVGYMDLCFLRVDEPELYEALFHRVGQMIHSIWKRFLREYGDIYCVCRFGDDLGFKSAPLLAAEDIRTLIIPEYKQIIESVHQAGKPFLLHSCGCIFSVMEDLIAAGIDAKHSNEDQIALFPEWVERYGDRIGNFGGIDTDAVCRLPKEEMEVYIRNVVEQCQGHGGFAFGSGNSIPDYVPVDQYLHMVKTVRRLRGENI
ncbi:MAG: uroporphyrinogen decarboxylase family protein [Faecousia sp.]